MAARIRIFLCVVLLSLTPMVRGETVLGRETDEFDFDGLPGAQHEFKVEVGAGREECFYQKISAGGKLHVSFEVIMGGDRIMDLYVAHTQTPHRPLKALVRKSNGFIYYDCDEGGAYAICLDNSFSRMASKLVYVYLVTYVDAEWEQYQQEIQDIDLTVANFTASLDMVKNSITQSLLHQAQSRMHVIKDWYLITGNNSYIQTWSIAQCAVIIVSTCVQVYFVRRLFRTVNVTPTAKPRA